MKIPKINFNDLEESPKSENKSQAYEYDDEVDLLNMEIP